MQCSFKSAEQHVVLEWRLFLLWRKDTTWHLDLKCLDNLLHSSTGWTSFASLDLNETMPNWPSTKMAAPQTNGVRNSSQSYPENMDWYAAAWDSNRKRCTWHWHGVESFRLANQVSRSRWDYLPKFDWRAPLLDGPGLYLFLNAAGIHQNPANKSKVSHNFDDWRLLQLQFKTVYSYICKYLL